MPWSAVFHRRFTPKLFCLIFLFSLGRLCAQDARPAASPAEPSMYELQSQIKELQQAVSELRSQTARYHAENLELRRQLEVALPSSAPRPSPGPPTGPSGEADDNSIEAQTRGGGAQATEEPSQPTGSTLQEQLQVLASNIRTQYQSKVESASKYRVRLSGIVLMNALGNRGSVDNLDFPHWATPNPPAGRENSFAGSLRQSMLGLEVFGPTLAGAKTSGEVQMDLAGGFAQTWNGVTSGLMRLRTGTVRMDWTNTSVIAGQDALFFAPLTPTSLASLAIPALAYSGSLWSWIPQVRLEHRLNISDGSAISLQAGIVDPLVGDFQGEPYFRLPQGGESSGYPGTGTRVAYTTRVFGQPLTVGTGGYYSRQNYGLGHMVDGWAGTSDWSLPLGSLFRVTGEFYRGKAIGGLGGALSRSIVAYAPLSDRSNIVKGLNDVGGWSQLKFTPLAKLEFNLAAGQDSSFAGDIRRYSNVTSYYDSLARNRSAFLNFIYHPRSDLLLSMEYQRLQSQTIHGDNHSANHISLSMGVLF